MGRVVLVTGGARSGKSAFAERWAADRAAERPGPGTVAYVATAVPTDDEMIDRIRRHRARRSQAWRTVEAPTDLVPAMRSACADAGVVLVDCLSVWAANRLIALDPEAPEGPEAAAWHHGVAELEVALVEELDAVVDVARAAGTDLVLVTNEVGFGLVPPTPLGRAYRDLLGRLNQHVAGRADAVHLVVAGIAVDLSRLGGTRTGDHDAP